MIVNFDLASIHTQLPQTSWTTTFRMKDCQLVQDSERSFTNSKNIPGMHVALIGNVITYTKIYNIPEKSFWHT